MDRKDVGNWIVMPYFGDTFGGKLQTQVGLKRSGAEMTTEEFVPASARRRAPTIARGIREQAAASPDTAQEVRRSLRPRSIAGSQGPDGLPRRSGVPGAHARGRLQADGRSQAALFHYGIFAKRLGTGWQAATEAYNLLAFDPPLPAADVVDTQRSLARKDYEYTCKAEPMCGVRESKLCRARPFGVGEQAQVPVIVGWREVVYGEDHVWFVSIEGSEDKRDSARSHRRPDQVRKVLGPSAPSNCGECSTR